MGWVGLALGRRVCVIRREEIVGKVHTYISQRVH